MNGLKDNSFSFTDNLYSKIVYEGGKGRRLFEEMIAQRIAGDYQIVKEGADKQGQGNKRAKNDKPSLDGQSSSIVHLASSNGDAWHSRRLVPQQQHAVAAGSAITRNNLAGSANSCTVSMGHRIQTLIYDGSSVHVRISRSKKNNNDADSQYKYTYSLWLSDCDGAMSKSDIRGTHIAVSIAKLVHAIYLIPPLGMSRKPRPSSNIQAQRPIGTCWTRSFAHRVLVIMRER